MDFGHIFKHAWQIPWKHKIFLKITLIVGIPSALISVITSLQYRSRTYFPSFDFFLNPQNIDPAEMDRLFEYNQQLSQNMWRTSLITIPLSLLSLAILLVGAIAIVKSVQQLKNGNEVVNFIDLRQQTIAILPRVILLNLVIAGLMFVGFFVLIIVMVILAVVTLGLGTLCLFPIWIIAAILLSAWSIQTNIALIIEDLSITEAIKYGWAILRLNAGNLAIMSFLLFLTGAFVSVITTAPSSIFSLFLNETSMPIQIILVVTFALLGLAGTTIIGAFSFTAWVLAYYNLPKRPEDFATSNQSPLPLKDLSQVEDALEQRKDES